FSGRGCTAYQDIPLLPVPSASPDLTPVTFSHANESAAPGAYSVLLDNGINVELSVTPRTGLGRITWPSGAALGSIVVNAAGSVNGASDVAVSIDAPHQLLTGHVTSQVGCGTDKYTLYFAIVFSQPIVDSTEKNGVASLTFVAWSPLELKPA